MMKSFNLQPLVLAIYARGAIAVFSSALFAPVVVAEQTLGVEETPVEVVVTGFRASLNNSINAKRAAAGSSDSIFAEEVAESPDKN